MSAALSHREEVEEFTALFDRCAMSGDLTPAMLFLRPMIVEVANERGRNLTQQEIDEISWNTVMEWGQALLAKLYIQERVANGDDLCQHRLMMAKVKRRDERRWIGLL